MITTIARINNRTCNLFATHFGLFLHASGVPQRVVNALSQIGLSISQKSIHRTVNSLSKEASDNIKKAAQSLQYMMVYDNLVVDYNSPSQSTIEKSLPSLCHLTTGTYINHHFNVEDLCCAEEIRKSNPHNDEVEHANKTQHRYGDLLFAYSQPPPDDSGVPNGLNLHQNFFAWHLRYVLCTHGPAYFKMFSKSIATPEVIDQIPVKKNDQVPVRAMKYDNSTVSGNIDSVMDMLQQGGINRVDPTEAPVPGQPDNLIEYVSVVCGDLGTAERLESGIRRRSKDLFKWHSMSDIAFSPGMFHVKMALVDTLWRLFIKPFSTEWDETSAVTSTKYLCPRPKDTNKLTKGPPTYQQMKRFLQHLGVAEVLACWKSVLEARFGASIWTDLDDPKLFDKYQAQLTWVDIEEISRDMVLTYYSMSSIRARRNTVDESQRDKQLENTMLRNLYMLMYEETVYAMNWGDVGRLERCILDWIPIFQSVGKHKYASHMFSFLVKLNFVYPDSLRCGFLAPS